MNHDINNFLNFLSFQVACEIEVNNLNFHAQDDITYHYPIQLN